MHLEAGGHWMARVSHPCGASWYQVPADPDGDVRVIIHPPETEPPETFYGA